MGISEKKMKIVIENYFKDKCNINTTIHDAFEKGFRIGVQKGISSERKKGKWNYQDGMYTCNKCHETLDDMSPYCPMCGADMRGEQE